MEGGGKRMGNVGKKKNSSLNSPRGLPAPTPCPLLEGEVSPWLASILKNNEMQYYGISSSTADQDHLPPKPLLSEFVLDSLASSSTITVPRLGPKSGRKKRRSKASATGVGTGPSNHPQKKDFLKSAEILQAYFPTHKIDDLADILQQFDGNMDEAMNALLDSGCTVAEEVILMEEATPTSESLQNENKTTPEEIKQSSKTTDPAENCQSGTSKTIGAASDNDNDNPESPKKSDDIDRTGWFNLPLSHEFIKKLALMYGEPDDPVIQAMLQKEDGYTTKVPPGLAFELYRKMVINAKRAKAKAVKEPAAKH